MIENEYINVVKSKYKFLESISNITEYFLNVENEFRVYKNSIKNFKKQLKHTYLHGSRFDKRKISSMCNFLFNSIANDIQYTVTVLNMYKNTEHEQKTTHMITMILELVEYLDYFRFSYTHGLK